MSESHLPAGGSGAHQAVYKTKSEEVFNTELAQQMVKRTDKLANTEIDLAIRVKQAREFMAWSAAHIRGEWLDWMENSTKAVQETTMTRMAFERETKTIKAAAKDIADFFNSPDYLKAHNTLGETVQLLEKFAQLKSNGTLDAFADFILKVTCK